MKYINEFIKYKEYKGEKAIYRVNDNCGNTYYSDEYVNWLEEQLRIHDVVGRSEQLVCDLSNADGWIVENKGDVIERRLCKCDKAN